MRFENYENKRVALHVMMLRSYTIVIVAIGTIFAYWLANGPLSGCWQTKLAQEIWRLLLVDFFISIIGGFVVQTICFNMQFQYMKYVDLPKFNVAQNTLCLIYDQTLFWMGFYLSPPLSIVVVAKMILTFYIKKLGLFKYCEMPPRTWRAAQTHALALALVFLGMVLVLGALGFIITNIPTNNCGPFRGNNYTWEAVIEKVIRLDKKSTLMTIVREITKPGIIASVLIAMRWVFVNAIYIYWVSRQWNINLLMIYYFGFFSTGVYYLRAKSQADKKMVQILRDMLVSQSRDKQFLIKRYTRMMSSKQNLW